MRRRAVATVLMAFLFLSTLTLSFNLEPVLVRARHVMTNPALPALLIVPQDFQTIQGAINAAYAGDTVSVSSGTYYENVVVNKTITLLGENPETTIIDGGGVGDVVSVTADNVTVMGFMTRNSGSDGSGVALGKYYYGAQTAKWRKTT